MNAMPSGLQFSTSPSHARQNWIEAGVAALRERFAAVGFTVPPTVRASIGWPKGSHAGRGAKTIGQCWAVNSSSDKHNEIFISPELGRDDPGSVKILGVLAHELVHATVGVEQGHKGAFKQVANAIGLCGKMTSTDEDVDFVAWAAALIERIGAYPGGRLSLDERKKQGTRLLKCACGACGYPVRHPQMDRRGGRAALSTARRNGR